MSKGKKIIILFLIGIVIIFVILLIYLNSRESQDQSAMTESQEQVAPTAEEPLQYELPPLDDEQINKAQIENSARIFAERFGTFSYYDNFDSLSEIKSMMTDSFYSWVNNTYKQQLSNEYNENSQYKSATAQAISSQITQYNETSAVVEITVMQIKKNIKENQELERKLKLEFVKQESDWLVNSAYWLK